MRIYRVGYSYRRGDIKYLLIFLVSINVLASGPFTYQVAEVVPFDNTTNGFQSEEVQSAIEEALALAISNDRFLVLFAYGGQANSGRLMEFYNGIDSQDAPLHFNNGTNVLQIICSTTGTSSNATIGFYNSTLDPTLIAPLYLLDMNGQKTKTDTGTVLVPLFSLASGSKLVVKIASGSIQKPHCQIVFSSSI